MKDGCSCCSGCFLWLAIIVLIFVIISIKLLSFWIGLALIGGIIAISAIIRLIEVIFGEIFD